MPRKPARTYSPYDYHRELLSSAQPSLAFTSDMDVALWQRKLRRKLRCILDVPARWDHTITCMVSPDSETDDYTCERVEFESEPNADVPGYLLKPKAAEPPFPVMICLQGHTPGMHISIGRANAKAEAGSVERGRDIALQAVRKGWAALAIEQRGFGERRGRDGKCDEAALHALMLGKTLTGERVFDVMRAIDFIATQRDLDRRRVACMGNSAGGTVSLYAACVDWRIRLAVVSCSFCALADSWMLHPHCACGYLPGLLKYADLGDVAGLIAPRHLLIVAGERDPIAEFAGVKRAFNQTRKVFRAAGCGAHVKLTVGDGGHEFYPELAWPEIEKVRGSWG